MYQLQMICVLAGFLWPLQTVENPDFQAVPAFCIDRVETVCMKCHIQIPPPICEVIDP
jgi:hypothetical protein